MTRSHQMKNVEWEITQRLGGPGRMLYEGRYFLLGLALGLLSGIFLPASVSWMVFTVLLIGLIALIIVLRSLKQPGAAVVDPLTQTFGTGSCKSKHIANSQLARGQDSGSST